MNTFTKQITLGAVIAASNATRLPGFSVLDQTNMQITYMGCEPF